MPRKLDARAATAFIERYRTGENCPQCGAGDPGVTVWDHYGAAPQEAGGEAEPGAGIYLAAVVSCDSCGHNFTLDRARLEASQTA